MLDFALVIGIILLIIGRKAEKYKYIRVLGLLIVLVCLLMSIPDAIEGFGDGFNVSR